MPTWADIKTIIRRSLVQDISDDDGEVTWDDNALFDAYTWGQRQLLPHIANTSVFAVQHGAVKDPDEPSVVWNLSSETEFTLPDDIFEELEISGIVYILHSDGSKTYLDPLFSTSELTPYGTSENGYWTSPYNVLHLDNPPGADTTLVIRYFSYWPEPEDGEDDEAEIIIPRWSIFPACYFAAAHCMTAPGTRSATIRQWNTKDDSGRPIDNALAAQADWLVKRAEHELARHTPQRRSNFFRANR